MHGKSAARGVPCPQGARAWPVQRAGRGSPGLNVTASGAAGWCGPRPIARWRAPRSRRWRGSAAAPPGGAARSRRRSRSGRGCAWRASACRCRVSPDPRPGILFIRAVAHVAHRPAGVHLQAGVAEAGMQAGDREPDPVQFGKRDSRGGAVVARRSCPDVPAVEVRQHAQLRFWQVAGGRGGDAVAADADPPVVSPWKVQGFSAATCVLAGTGRDISRTIVASEDGVTEESCATHDCAFSKAFCPRRQRLMRVRHSRRQ